MSLIDCGDGVRLERGVRCVMSDGVVLVSDHYYPASSIHGKDAWPTLLMRQPYGRDIASTVVYAHPIWFARRGYHVVIQDVRGRGDSGGDFYPFRSEGRDGAETIAWLRRHSACNGHIGMYGFSYQGSTQLLAAVEKPEGLVCIAPHMTAADLYHGWFYHQGALRLASTLGWGIQMLREDARRLGLRIASDWLDSVWLNVKAQAAVAPYARHSAIADPELPGYVRDWVSHRKQGGEDRGYWSGLDISGRVDQIEVPALHIAGWYDTYLEGSIAGYRALRNGAGTEFARRNQYLLVGPWVHIPWGDHVGDSKLGQEANFNTDELLLKWFNHWLKSSGDFHDEPRVRHFVLGANRWEVADEWPEEAETVLYLHSLGNANSRSGDGDLNSNVPTSEEACDVFVYDPEVPVLAPGGALSLSGVFDQAVLEMGNNLLVYTSAPLAEELQLFGQPRMVLYASTSASNADMTAKLVKILPDRRAEFICIGIARSSFLFGDEWYTADEVHRWEFTLEPTSITFSPGDAIRLEVASSAFPLYDRNPSSQISPDLADPWTWKRSTQRVLHSREYPSALYLPLVRSKAA